MNLRMYFFNIIFNFQKHKLQFLLLSAAPIQGSPQRMFFKHPHRTFGNVLRRMHFLTQPTDGRET